MRIALRTQQVIAHETGVVNTIDPLGGSYYVEHLTNELERQAYEYFDRIDKLGGVVAAIKENFFQREMAEASFRYQAEVEAEQRVVVGVNRYKLEGEPELEILKIDPALEAQQIARVQALRARRDGGAVEAALDAAEGRRRARAAQPDGADRRGRPGLRDDGRDVRRPARGLGHLARNARLLSVPILRGVAGKIRVVIAKPGLDGHDRGAKIIARALRDAGMEVIYTGLHQTPEQIVETAIQEDADAVGISILSGRAHDARAAHPRAAARRRAPRTCSSLVGGTIPQDDIAELKQQGVAEVFTPGAPTSEIVDFLQSHVPVSSS